MNYWMKRTLSIVLCAILSLCTVHVGLAQQQVPKLVIPYQYEFAGSFSEGLALVKKDGKESFIDPTGQIVVHVETPTDYTWRFSEGMAKIMRDGKYGFLDRNGKEVIRPQYEDSADFFQEGMAAVKKGDKWGFVDQTGKEIIPLRYNEVGSFYEGRAWVKNNKKMGFVDPSGKEVIPLQYDSVSNFYEGLASVTKAGKTVFIDTTGAEVKLNAKYDYILGFSEGLGIVIESGRNGEPDKYGVIDRNGKEIVKPYYERIISFKDGFAKVQLNGNWGFIDRTGKEIVKPQYHHAYDFNEGLAHVSKNLRHGFVDASGNEVIRLQYEFAWDFSEGLAPVMKNDKWGYIASPLGGPVNGPDTPDDWAADAIALAANIGLIPDALQGGYKKMITRQEFCELVIQLIRVQTGQSIAAYLAEQDVEWPDAPFTDTTNEDVAAAYALGIVSGKGAGRFDPYGSITREEAAVMLHNTAKALGSDTSASPSTFADSEYISAWAESSVDYVSSKGIMSGIGNNKFDPKGSYTRQQALVTILRLYG